MSSTNRSNARDNHVSDYYVTPQNHISLFLDNILEIEPDLLEGRILDPCAGGDKKTPMSYPSVLKKYGCKNIDTIDIRKDSRADIIGNFLLMRNLDNYNLIITNPPFVCAKQIINKSLRIVNDGGFVVMLLRLNFFGSKDREMFWKKHMPKYCFVHTRRMSFYIGNNSKMDSVEYMHCVWQKGYNKNNTKLFLVN